MLKRPQVSLAVALTAMLGSSMTAIAQEQPEFEDLPSPDQSASDPAANDIVQDEPAFRQAAVEASPTAEFSEPSVEPEFEPAPPETVAVESAQAPPYAEPAYSEPVHSQDAEAAGVQKPDAPAARSVPVAVQSPIPQAAKKPVEAVKVAQVVVPTTPVTSPSPAYNASVTATPVVEQSVQPPLRQVSAVEQNRAIEFSTAARPVSAKNIVIEVAPTQEVNNFPQPDSIVPPTSPSLVQGPILIPAPGPIFIPPDNSKALQQQLLQLQQQQRQLEQQLNSLQQQVVPLEKGSPVVVGDNNPQNLTFTGEALFWKPGFSDTLDYAIADPGTALATSGDLKQVELDSATGGRFGLNYRLPNSGWDIGGKYTYFNTQGSSSATSPVNGFLFSTQSHPFQNETADTADATAKLGYKTGDFEAGYNIKAGKVDLRLFGGVRVADVDRKMTANYNGRDYTNGQIQMDNSFTGVGPRVGLEAKVPLGAGFNLFGKGAVSMQVGTSTSRFRETDRNGADVIADLRRERGGTVVPGLELAAGLGWEKAISKQAKINISGGYELQNLFNATDNIRFVDAASPGVFSQNQGNLNLKGFFVRGGVTFNF